MKHCQAAVAEGCGIMACSKRDIVLSTADGGATIPGERGSTTVTNFFPEDGRTYVTARFPRGENEYGCAGLLLIAVVCPLCLQDTFFFFGWNVYIFRLCNLPAVMISMVCFKQGSVCTILPSFFQS